MATFIKKYEKRTEDGEVYGYEEWEPHELTAKDSSEFFEVPESHAQQVLRPGNVYQEVDDGYVNGFNVESERFAVAVTTLQQANEPEAYPVLKDKERSGTFLSTNADGSVSDNNGDETADEGDGNRSSTDEAGADTTDDGVSGTATLADGSNETVRASKPVRPKRKPRNRTGK